MKKEQLKKVELAKPEKVDILDLEKEQPVKEKPTKKKPAKKKAAKKKATKKNTSTKKKAKSNTASGVMQKGSPEDIALTKISGFDFDERALIKRTIAPKISDEGIALLGQMAKATGLNPFVREIYPTTDADGKTVIVATRDGFRKLANNTPEYIGCNSMEVRQKDICEISTINNQIFIAKHSYTPSAERAKSDVIGAYAVAKVKRAGEIVEIVEWADFSTYNRNTGAWLSHPEEMIKKVPEAHALKKVANISGLYVEEELNTKFDSEGNAFIDQEEQGGELSLLLEEISNAKTKEDLLVVSEKAKQTSMKHAERKKVSDAYIAKSQEIASVTQQNNDK